MDSPFWFAEYLLLIENLTALTAIVILISSLDDLFIDLYYWIREIYRALFIRQRYGNALPIAELSTKPERPFAIMAPAWHEHEVIAQMVENTVTTLEYHNFKIFIGVYCNDPATMAEAERMTRRYHQVVRVIVPHDGPTCKADCLNWIIQAIFLHEETHQIEFAGVVMHDSEDVIHPLELKLFNYLIHRKDFIQLPVLSLEREWYEFTASTYKDDFAEWHQKDLVVRESMTKMVPGAGVGSCYSRRAIAALCRTNKNQPFNTDTLTEDYDFSFRLKTLGMKQIFVKFPIEYQIQRKYFFGWRESKISVKSLIATREYFPSTFRAAYRQRARWIIGIAFQGMQHVGWRGNLATKYLLFRDRKGLLTSLVAIFAYGLLINFLVLRAFSAYGFGLVAYPSFIQPGSWIFDVFIINAFLLTNRVLQRFYFVSRLYGIEQGFLAIPRIVVSNFINFFATVRAWKQFIIHYVTATPIAWDKTQHSYPSTAELRTFKRRLGELLLSWKAVDTASLDLALAEHFSSGRPLGQILLQQNLIQEDTLADALAVQCDLQRASIDWATIKDNLRLLPHYLMIRHRIVPLGVSSSGIMSVAVANPPTPKLDAKLADYSAETPIYFIAKDSEVDHALRLAAGQKPEVTEPAPRRLRLLGDVLVDQGYLTPALLGQSISEYDPSQDGSIGQFLIKRGLINSAQLDEALARQTQDQSTHLSKMAA